LQIVAVDRLIDARSDRAANQQDSQEIAAIAAPSRDYNRLMGIFEPHRLNISIAPDPVATDAFCHGIEIFSAKLSHLCPISDKISNQPVDAGALLRQCRGIGSQWF